MSIGSIGSSPSAQSFGSGGENEDLKAERKAIQRQSLKEGNEAFKLSEKKKNIEAIR